MGPDNLCEWFSRCYVISLARRPDRLEAFKDRITACGWPFQQPQVFQARDGAAIPQTVNWSQGGGSYGCLLSHKAIIEQCLSERVPSVLILEDDAAPCENFVGRCREFFPKVPDDWAMLYLGGQLLDLQQNPPWRINDQVVLPWNVNLTHAYALTREGMIHVYRHLIRTDWDPKHHIDHHLGRMHAERPCAIYCPANWLMFQAEGKSDVCDRKLEERSWQVSEDRYKQALPFYAIVGLHSSGSSAIAGVCYHLGMFLGDRLAGFYGTDPANNCGFEARGFMDLGERLCKFPTTNIIWTAQNSRDFHGWISFAWNRAKERKTVSGVKYPILCRIGDRLHGACGNQLRVIHCVRPLEDSIKSLATRGGTPKCTPEEADIVQRWLWEGKEAFLANIPEERKLDVSFYELLENPEPIVRRIARFMETSTSEEKIARAVASVKKDKWRIGRT